MNDEKRLTVLERKTVRRINKGGESAENCKKKRKYPDFCMIKISYGSLSH